MTHYHPAFTAFQQGGTLQTCGRCWSLTGLSLRSHDEVWTPSKCRYRRVGGKQASLDLAQVQVAAPRGYHGSCAEEPHPDQHRARPNAPFPITVPSICQTEDTFRGRTSRVGTWISKSVPAKRQHTEVSAARRVCVGLVPPNRVVKIVGNYAL